MATYSLIGQLASDPPKCHFYSRVGHLPCKNEWIMKQNVSWSEIPIAQALTRVFSCVGKHVLIIFLSLSFSWWLWYKPWLSALWSIFFTISVSRSWRHIWLPGHKHSWLYLGKKNEKQYFGWSFKENACKIFVCVCALNVLRIGGEVRGRGG